MDNDERLLGRPNKPRRDWLGFLGLRDKTLWDLMGLLIVPLFIAGATLFFSLFELQREDRRVQAQQQIEDDRVRQTVLQSYIRDMTGLLLDKGLATSEPDHPVRDIARSSTLTAVRQLDANLKAILLQFLYESNLIGMATARGETFADESREQIEPVINLTGADLRSADLSRANLTGADLSNAILSGANLSRAFLGDANLTGAFLSDADLSVADLTGADLSRANLTGADLSVADLGNAILSGAFLDNADLTGADLSVADLSVADLSVADLSRANLTGADLSVADLGNANLTGAKGWTNEQLAYAESLVGAILPDGTVIRTAEAWEAFKKRYRAGG